MITMIIMIVDDHSHYGCGNYFATIGPFSAVGCLEEEPFITGLRRQIYC